MNLQESQTFTLIQGIVESIDPRFTVETFVDTDERDRKIPSYRISMPHHVHGTLDTSAPLREGIGMVRFWPEQKRHMLDQTREEQIQEFADSMNRSYEECEAYINSKNQ